VSDAAEYQFILVDGDGQELDELTHVATGKKVTYQRNWYSEASCTIDVEDDAALLLREAERTGWPRMKVYRRGAAASTATTVFYGELLPTQAQADVGSTLQLSARSPFGRVLGTGNGTGFTSIIDVSTVAGSDAGLYAHYWILVPGLLGSPSNLARLAAGNLEYTKTLGPRFYKAGQNVGEVVVDLASALDGFDFKERFIDDDNTSFDGWGVMAYLDIYASLGEYRPDARFEYGHDTLGNLSAVSQTKSPPITAVFLMGGNGLIAAAGDMDALARYGGWPLTRTYSAITDQTLLNDRATALLRPYPIITVDMTPGPEAPRPFDDFDVGDTCPVYIDRGYIQVDRDVRLNGFTIVIDEDGHEAAEIPDPLLPDEEAYVRANLEIEVLPE
jgi:hypothetical protein